MKKVKLLTLIFALAVLFCFLVSPEVGAAEYNGLTYEITDGVVTITGCDTSVSGELVIPSEIEGYPVMVIGDSAFSGCDQITKVAMPSSITFIETYAFEGCTDLTGVYITDLAAWCNIGFGGYESNPLENAHNLYLNGALVTELTIPDGVVSIGNYAFAGASCITKVNLPETLKSIGEYAFSYCTAIPSITVPSGVESINYAAFYDCTNLSAVYINDLAAWCRISFGDFYANPLETAHNLYLNGTLCTELNIPYGITEIYSNTFLGCTSIKNVIVPDSVTQMGFSAFQGFENLESITLPFVGQRKDRNPYLGYIFGSSTFNSGLYVPRSLKTVIISETCENVPAYAFTGCGNLTSITIPNSVTFIGESAFHGCYGLANITIPDNVTYIGDFAFLGCSSLTSVNIPDGVTSIEYGTFNGCSSLNYVTIPYGVTYIVEEAFAGCTSITSITVPDSVTNIEYAAFSGCSKLESITLPFVGGSATSNQFLGYIFGASSYSNNSSYVPSSLKTVVLSDACESIPAYAFTGCESLTSITIPDSVTAIATYAFQFCSNLKNIVIPNSVTSIGSYAFQNCVRLENITLPNSINGIGTATFNNCKSLKNVNIPYGVTYIGNGTFSGCSILENIIIPDSVVSIGSSFQNCSNLKNIVIPTSVTTIGSYAFQNCTGLENIILPDSVTSVGLSAFSGCSKLESITLPFIGGSADANQFLGYIFGASNYSNNSSRVPSSLKTVVISSACKNICSSAFEGCSNLTNVIIPNSVTSIGYYVFKGCNNLKSITLPFVGTSVSDDRCFGFFFGASSYSDNSSYVPSSLETVIISDGCESIRSNAFYNCANLKNIIIPDSVTNMGRSLFEGCNSLESITLPFIGNNPDSSCPLGAFFGASYTEAASYIPSSLKTIILSDSCKSISMAFAYCTNFESIKLPNSLTNVGTGAFDSCVGLKRIDIPCNVTSIDNSSFARCTNLTTLSLTNNVTDIGNYAFFKCTNLSTVWYSGTKEESESITIGTNNEALKNATWYYNICLPTDHMYDNDGDAHCNKCEYRRNIKLSFNGASLTLHNNLTVNYKVDKALFEEAGYENPYVLFEINGEKRIVKSYTVEGDNYIFKLKNIAPNQMNDTIYATLYAKYDGVLYNSETREYSIAQYCYNMLKNYSGDEYAKLRTLIVDLLQYGAQSQLYTGHNTDNLVNAALTAEQLSWGTAGTPTLQNVLNTKYETVENPIAQWKGAGLLLNNAVIMKLKFTADDIKGLTVKIRTEDDEWTIESADFKKEDGLYYVTFAGLGAGQMSENVYLTIYKGETAISNTARYSIESYAYGKQNGEDAKLSALVNAMMNYGNSARDYN